MNAAPRLAVAGLAKAFAGVPALVDAHLEVRAGEAHALLGENGAGKSTLLRCLTGVLRPDAGRMRLDGAEYAPASPATARARGVHLIPQEPSLVPGLSVAENLFLGCEPRRGPLVAWREMRARADAVFERLGVRLDPAAPAAGLTVAEQQMVELARALLEESRVLLLDEPTSALGPREAERLFAVLHGLKADGVALVHVSHRLDEVRALCERATILRDGRWVACERLADLDDAAVVQRMVGRALPPRAARRAAPGEVVLAVEELRGEGFRDASFELRRGEILALAGLVGSGRSALAQALVGAPPARGGTIRRRGSAVRFDGPRTALAHGVALLPEDRKAMGIVPELSVRANLGLSSLHRCARAGFVDRRRERALAVAGAAAVRLRAASLEMPIAALSGGNQQKALLARLLRSDAEVLVVDEPTRGVDVAAKAELHELLRGAADAGRAVLVVSSELPEVLALADRVLVMREGGITGELVAAEATEERILALAT